MCVCVCVCVYKAVHTNRMRHKVIFKEEFNRFEFKVFLLYSSSCHNMVKEFCLPYCLLLTGKRIVVFIDFSRMLALCEMQTASFRI